MKILCVILSGGRGKRLWPITFFIQKTLLPVPGGRRIIDYSIDSCLLIDSDKIECQIIVLAKYKSYQVQNYLKKKYSSVSVLIEKESMGTGGALIQHWEEMCNINPDALLILNGDHFVQLPLRMIVAKFIENNSPAVLVGVYSVETYHDYLNVKDGFVVTINKSSDKISNFAYTGISMLRFGILKEFISELQGSEYCNITRDILIKICNRYKGDYFILGNAWNDLGTWYRYFSFLYNNF